MMEIAVFLQAIVVAICYGLIGKLFARTKWLEAEQLRQLKAIRDLGNHTVKLSDNTVKMSEALRGLFND